MRIPRVMECGLVEMIVSSASEDSPVAWSRRALRIWMTLSPLIWRNIGVASAVYDVPEPDVASWRRWQAWRSAGAATLQPNTGKTFG